MARTSMRGSHTEHVYRRDNAKDQTVRRLPMSSHIRMDCVCSCNKGWKALKVRTAQRAQRDSNGICYACRYDRLAVHRKVCSSESSGHAGCIWVCKLKR